MIEVSGSGAHADQMRALIRQHPYRCHRWLRSGHLQTIVGSRQRRRFDWGWTDAETVRIPLSGGSRIDALWVEIDRRSPTLVAVHGMSGSNRSAYMLGLSHKAHRRGWNSLLLDLYDRSESPRIFHAGSSADVFSAIDAFRSERALGDVLLAGVSMGGNLVLKLVGEMADRVPDWLRGAGVVSPLVDLMASWHLMDLPSNRIYRKYYVRRLKALAASHLLRRRPEIDPVRLRRVRSIRQFDEAVTVPVAGFSDVFDYYRRASAVNALDRIVVPTVAIHSRDDPFLPAEPLLRSGLGDHPALSVVLTERGGHVAFIEDRCVDLDRSWAENRLIEFFSCLI